MSLGATSRSTMDGGSPDRGKDSFIWGTVVAGISSLPFILLALSVLNAFRGISQDKATGLGAIAGGLAEFYVTSGLILTFILPIIAIVLLGRSFSGGNQTRKLFSLLFTCWSAFVLLLYSLGAWLFLVQLPHLTGGPR